MLIVRWVKFNYLDHSYKQLLEESLILKIFKICEYISLLRFYTLAISYVIYKLFKPGACQFFKIVFVWKVGICVRMRVCSSLGCQ